ncbi:MAG: phosphatase PAP2 family protein [Bacteroidales bacterium]|nr:phosphatase PAP2 family protein [Bacteroidales bacterium]
MSKFTTAFALLAALLLIPSCSATRTAAVSGDIPTYFTIDDMPDLVKCLPAPPSPGSAEFAYDSLRYYSAKKLRGDKERMAMANSDAVWSLDTLFAQFFEPFGMELSPATTPQIWALLESGISTIELIRIRPKAHFHRVRPFEYFNEHTFTEWEEDFLRGEGSYPSGHTIRGWGTALLLTEVNPAAADALYKRAWQYGESRVLVGAHWQSDVDVSRAAASIGYAKLQTSSAFRAQVRKAQAEFKRLQRAR